jgi:heterodisulfide reductase subunit E
MYMYFEATALLYILTVFTLGIFLFGVYASIYLWRKGKAPSLHHRLLTGPIIKALILDALLQAQLLRQSVVRWIMHMCLFWGFLGLLAHTTFLAVMSHFIPADSALSRYVFLGPGKPFLDVWGDLWGLILLIGLIIAFVRRYVVKAEQLDSILMDNTALIFLFAIALTGFLSEAQRLAASPYDPSMRYSFIGTMFASCLRANPALIADYIPVVWVHTLISLVFLSIIPFSKTWHAFVSPVEIALDASERTPLGERYGGATH